MRTFRLARIAAEAEGLRLRQRTRRTAMRAALGFGAFGFLMGTVVFCHLAGWYWLRQTWQQPASALIVAGIDLVLAGFLILLATRSSPNRVELEALAVRQRAMESMTSTLAISALATQLLRL